MVGTPRPRVPRARWLCPPHVFCTASGARESYSERDVVVHVGVAGAGGCDRAARAAAGAAGAETAPCSIGADTATPSAAAGAVQPGHVGVEALQHHLGGVFLHPALVGPFARLQRALDINLGAFLQVLLGDLREPFAEDHHAMPLGLFLALAGRLVAPALGGRDAQIHHRIAVLHAPDLRVLAQIADQNDLVDRTRHLELSITARRLPAPYPFKCSAARPAASCPQYGQTFGDLHCSLFV